MPINLALCYNLITRQRHNTAMTQPGILLSSLRSQAQRYPTELREIEISLVAQEFKRAYVLMSRLKERSLWQPSPEAEEALEDFWWEYGQ